MAERVGRGSLTGRWEPRPGACPNIRGGITIERNSSGIAAWEFGALFHAVAAFGLRKTTIKVSDFIQHCSHPHFTLEMLGASSCPPSPGTEAIQ